MGDAVKSDGFPLHRFTTLKEIYISRDKDVLVVKARENAKWRPVAIKTLLKASMSRPDQRRLRREVAIAARMSGDHVTKVYETFEDTEKFYIVMEYCDGGDLFDYLEKRAGATPTIHKLVIEVIVPLLRVLEKMHSLQLIHRDIKPENVFLKKDGGVCVGDFGLSIDQAQDVPFSCSGTLAYMAPEVVHNRLVQMDEGLGQTRESCRAAGVSPYTEKVDIWSLGVLVLELMRDMTPFHNKDEHAAVAAILTHQFGSPRPGGRTWEDFVRCALIRDPEARWSAQQLLQHPWIQLHLKHANDGSPAVAKLLQPLPLDQGLKDYVEPTFVIPTPLTPQRPAPPPPPLRVQANSLSVSLGTTQHTSPSPRDVRPVVPQDGDVPPPVPRFSPRLPFDQQDAAQPQPLPLVSPSWLNDMASQQCRAVSHQQHTGTAAAVVDGTAMAACLQCPTSPPPAYETLDEQYVTVQVAGGWSDAAPVTLPSDARPIVGSMPGAPPTRRQLCDGDGNGAAAPFPAHAASVQTSLAASAAPCHPLPLPYSAASSRSRHSSLALSHGDDDMLVHATGGQDLCHHGAVEASRLPLLRINTLYRHTGSTDDLHSGGRSPSAAMAAAAAPLPAVLLHNSQLFTNALFRRITLPAESRTSSRASSRDGGGGVASVFTDATFGDALDVLPAVRHVSCRTAASSPCSGVSSRYVTSSSSSQVSFVSVSELDFASSPLAPDAATAAAVSPPPACAVAQLDSYALPSLSSAGSEEGRRCASSPQSLSHVLLLRNISASTPEHGSSGSSVAAAGPPQLLQSPLLRAGKDERATPFNTMSLEVEDAPAGGRPALRVRWSHTFVKLPRAWGAVKAGLWRFV